MIHSAFQLEPFVGLSLCHYSVVWSEPYTSIPDIWGPVAVRAGRRLNTSG